MKVAILAGGRGTRMGDYTRRQPKPMVTVGDRPILWHIMRHYAHYGFEDFVIALGYRGEVIKKYMRDFRLLETDLRVDVGSGQTEAIGGSIPEWTVELIETGPPSRVKTGGRIKRLQPYVGENTFMLTWGDGVSDIHLGELREFHRSHDKLATVTLVHPPTRFGHAEIDDYQVTRFTEKPGKTRGWINGAFFVLEPEIFGYIHGDQTRWEEEPMERLAAEGQLMAFQHESFWYCMDTPKDRQRLERMWNNREAPWKVWEPSSMPTNGEVTSVE